MKLRSELLIVALGACLAGGAGVAAVARAGAPSGQQVYTWVDKNGVRHYADHPGNPNAVLVSVDTAAPASNAPPAAVASATHAASAPVPRTVPLPAPHSASAAERAQRCATLRAQVQQLQSARRVQVTENGKTRYVTGQNLVKFREKMRKRMQQACTPSSP